MNIEQRVAELESRVNIAEKNALESVDACSKFRLAVAELMEHSKNNADAIIEHIAQLDTEKEEVVDEYRQELCRVQSGFNKNVQDLNESLNKIKSSMGVSKELIGE